MGLRHAVGLPWRQGPDRFVDSAWVTATRFEFTTTAAAVTAGRHTLRFWATWSQIPGAIGLSVRYQPLPRLAWTLSFWSQASDLDGFLRSPAHRALVRTFHHRLVGASTGWQCTTFDLKREWNSAVEALGR